MRYEIAKINSKLVALRLLYTVMPITKFRKKVEIGLFSQSGSHTCYKHWEGSTLVYSDILTRIAVRSFGGVFFDSSSTAT